LGGVGSGEWEVGKKKGVGKRKMKEQTKVGQIETYKDLIVWQEAMKLVEMVYLETRNFPREEMYGLTSQMRRAAVSVPANIAEGNGRSHLKEYLQFLSIANGSLRELETHLLIAERLQFLQTKNLETMISQLNLVGKLLTALRKALIKKI
jgi:four helix bundle protein